ncbi:MAG: EscU/YscU/HrcU family type III secretion system export apparatus switch protein [Acidimicrobiales bacterium]
MKGDSRTEKPTAKRRADARKKGQAARSQELPQAASLVAGLALLPVVMPAIGTSLQSSVVAILQRKNLFEPGVASASLAQVLFDSFIVLSPLLVGVGATSVIAQMALVGKPNPHKLKPKFTNLDPRQGFKRVFSVQALWELFRTIMKLSALIAVGWGVWQTSGAFFLLGPAPIQSSLNEIRGVLGALFAQVALLGLLIGLADTAFVKFKFLRELRMSKAQVKDEQRQQEGDPQVKGEIRRQQLKMSRGRMIAAVADASILVTNPTHLSVALAYEDGQPAPVVVAKGAGELAMRMRDEARRHGVPIRENKPVARQIFRSVDVGSPIPAGLYRAVAEILASIYRAKRARSTKPGALR